MTTVTIEYSNNNVVLNGILEAVAKMPDVVNNGCAVIW